ncbi:cytochrome P450 [Whalleya microplaca]|nr:cytochrome P450 [Whalleya microplaca]
MESAQYTSSVTVILVFFILSSSLLGFARGKYSSVTSKKESRYCYPQGPEPWPILGNLIDLLKIFKNPDGELLKMAKKYRSVVMMWLGSQPVLIINNAKDAKDMLDHKGSVYSDRPSQNSFRQRAWPWRLLGIGVGPQFRLLRSIYNRLLGPQQSLKFRDYQDYEAAIMLKDLLHAPGEFQAHSERFAISVMFSAIYGVRLARLDHPVMTEFYNIWTEMLHYFQPGTLLVDYFPILEKLPERFQPWVKLASDLQKRESKLYRAFLTTLKTQVQEGIAPNCFGAELMKIQENEEIDDDQAIGILGMLIGAGADAPSSVLQTFFKIMAMNPKALRAAQEELDRVVGPSRMPTWEDEPNLPYLRALIKEVHRWAPVGSLGVPHAASQEDLYLGRRIPKGTVIFPNLTALNRDSEIYKDPDDFCPERFLGDNLNASASANHPDFRKRDHFHYGFGRRVCQGIFVAEASLYIVIARAIWAFDIAPQPGAPPLDLGDKIPGLITKPRPYRVSIVARSDVVKQVIQDTVSGMTTDVLDFDSVKLVGELGT